MHFYFFTFPALRVQVSQYSKIVVSKARPISVVTSIDFKALDFKSSRIMVVLLLNDATVISTDYLN